MSIVANPPERIDNASSWETRYNASSWEHQNVSEFTSVLETTTYTVPRYQPPPLDTNGLVLIPSYSLIFVLSVLGNSLVIITLIQNKRMRTVTNVFLLNLSFSDLLLAVFCMPFTIMPMLLKNFIFGSTMCVLIRYLQGVSVGASCFTMVAISLERYFAICRPLRSRRWQTLSHSYKASAVCWSLAFILMIPIAVYTRLKPLGGGNYSCTERWDNLDWERAYAIILPLLLLLYPLVIMSVSYGMISYTLWIGMKLEEQMEKDAHAGNGTIRESETTMTVTDGLGRTMSPTNGDECSKPVNIKRRFDVQRGMRQSNSERSRIAKKRVIKMLFAIVLEFFVCWAPLYVVQTWIIVDYRSAQKHIPPMLVSYINLLAYVSSCCNPITYCFMNRNFRQGFLTAFRCCRRRSSRKRGDILHSGNYMSTPNTATSQVVSNYDKANESDEF